MGKAENDKWRLIKKKKKMRQILFTEESYVLSSMTKRYSVKSCMKSIIKNRWPELSKQMNGKK